MKIAKRTARTSLSLLIAATLTLTSTSALTAITRDQAKAIHDRLAGVPPTDAVLNQMVADGTANGAAFIAMQNRSFYDNTVKNLALPWTNREQSVFVPLNDYAATVVGMVRDDVPFNTLLSADLVYIAKSGTAGVNAAYSPANNDMYDQLDAANADLQASLVSSPQSALTGVPAAATAGIITTRAAAQAFFVNGTNRAMFRFTMLNHLCHDMEAVQDITRPPDRIRQDVSRSPGGDSRIFLTSWVGCHSGMDPMAQAFAYYNFDNTALKIVYTARMVQPKYLINSDNFKSGYITPDDHWDNRWRAGPNAYLGFTPVNGGSGDGAKSLGQELANSDAFAQCQVQKVFKNVCYRAPSSAADYTAVNSMVATFKSGYKMRQVFADAAVYCVGGGS